MRVLLYICMCGIVFYAFAVAFTAKFIAYLYNNKNYNSNTHGSNNYSKNNHRNNNTQTQHENIASAFLGVGWYEIRRLSQKRGNKKCECLTKRCPVAKKINVFLYHNLTTLFAGLKLKRVGSSNELQFLLTIHNQYAKLSKYNHYSTWISMGFHRGIWNNRIGW